ncbi:response regulator transcription factor [Tenacibaculum ovolyticum]|uniref:LytR/AlgR family response regulator transcription factor n=1 Tax=Tenacibaculum ovolyticum TaxID=104270 RepID=UPI0022F3A6AE|nr:response regulator transcription factor [Tenacibaculum ovolyticum]WBX78428.1 response regulator transcription factor [Tenacibaculum ovolyticum]
MRYLIIDDEHIAHKIIMEYCEMLPAMQLQKNCYSALEALEYLNTHEVDLIFLDLNMPKLKGFEFLKTLTLPPKVIVTTAYSEFAIDGYELNITDYLLKPYSFERFLKAVNKVNDTLNTNKETAIPKQENEDTTNKQIFLKQQNSHIQVAVNTILYIEASGNYIKVFTTTDTITVRGKISDILALLPENKFLQVHKSFAIATTHIQRIEGNRIHIGNTVVPIGKLYKVNVNELLR